MNKYKSFIVCLVDGSIINVRAPYRVTEAYAERLAYHWAKVPKESVFSVKGIV